MDAENSNCKEVLTPEKIMKDMLLLHKISEKNQHSNEKDLKGKEQRTNG
jgi:hypothetical protein